jgi:alkylated DNA repair protein (DNA oxidative demethylase)
MHPERNGSAVDPVPHGFEIRPGFLGAQGQAEVLDAILSVIAAAPLFRPVMPRTGKPFSVSMTSCGVLGWVSDTNGYRYQATHPGTGRQWPPMPEPVLAVWRAVSNYPHEPEACLVNYYEPTARMGLHRDEDEQDFKAPVVSISLGDDCRCRVGGFERGGATRSFRLRSGDVAVLGGESRLAFHGVDRIYPGTSNLLAPHFPQGGRINLTLRRVTVPVADLGTGL